MVLGDRWKVSAWPSLKSIRSAELMELGSLYLALRLGLRPLSHNASLRCFVLEQGLGLGVECPARQRVPPHSVGKPHGLLRLIDRQGPGPLVMMVMTSLCMTLFHSFIIILIVMTPLFMTVIHSFSLM